MFYSIYSNMICIKCLWEYTPEKERHTLCQKCYDKFEKSEPRDYQLLVNKDTPKDIRRKMDIWDIWSNCIKCNKCWDIIRSKNRHDFKMCKCGNCWVDWGSWYGRLIGDDYINLSEGFTDVID